MASRWHSTPTSTWCSGSTRRMRSAAMEFGRAPRVNPYCHLRAREGADGQAVVCPLLRGSSPTRGVAPKQHRGPALTWFITLSAREGADGQAVVCPLLRGSSPTRGVAPKQHRGPRVLSLRHFSGWFSLSLGAWVPQNLARRRMVSAGAMLLDRLGPPGFRFTDFRAPALTSFITLSAREGADGQAVVCPLLRGSSPTRGVAPKQHRGLRRAFSPA